MTAEGPNPTLNKYAMFPLANGYIGALEFPHKSVSVSLTSVRCSADGECMSDGDCLLVEMEGGVAHLTLNRPSRRNSLSPALVQSLCKQFASLKDNKEVRVIVLTGAGNKVFCAGGDLGKEGLFQKDNVIQAHHNRAAFGRLFQLMQSVGKPIIARLQGHALGGGFGLAMAADIVVAVDDARLGAPEINLGLFPMVIMATLTRNIPRKPLMELILTGASLSAEDAAVKGYINYAVPRDQLDATVASLLEKLLNKSPMAMALGRDTFYAIQDMTFEQSLGYLNSQLSLNLMAEDVAEGVEAFFQKRPPHWKGR